jgi:hypothetical protein
VSTQVLPQALAQDAQVTKNVKANTMIVHSVLPTVNAESVTLLLPSARTLILQLLSA